MTKERIEEIAIQCRTIAGRTWSLHYAMSVKEIADYLAPFLIEPAPKKSAWIKCSERMPAINQLVYWFLDGYIESAGICHNPHTCRYSHWMPREVPQPPEPEDSETIRELKQLPGNYSGAVEEFRHKAIAIVRKHEQKGKV